MPSSNDFVPDFDNFDDQSPFAAPQPYVEAFDPPPPPKSKKKKKGKKDAAVWQWSLDDGEDSSGHPKSIPPSPPTDHSVRLRQAPPPPRTHEEPVAPSSPLVNLGDEVTGLDHVDPSPPPIPSPQLPSPVVRSPRAIPAKPVFMTTPPSRPASLYAPSQRDRTNSLTGYRPLAPAAQQAQQRRESFVAVRPRFVDPPPPHMPQAHFFGLPDLGLTFGQKKDAGHPAGSDGYCCRIDSLADAGDDVSAKKARDAMLVGYEGGLEVFRILPNKLEVVGRLEGLRGSVIGAKILPHTDKFDDLQVFRPLVAVIIHGAMANDQRNLAAAHEGKDILDNQPSHFQTTVDVYSLQTQHYIATLYSSTPIAVDAPAFGQITSLPEPVGDLHLDASGQFITVSSGKSGEVLVFTQASRAGDEETRFRSIGKFWTSIQNPMTVSRPVSASNGSGGGTETREEPRKPLVSLSPRWMAIVPPYLSSSISIQGAPLLSDINSTPPGMTAHAAPPQPLVTCEVVGTDVEGTWSRLGRQAAQGLVRYSQKGIEMSMQGWKELTQPSPPGGRSAHDRSSSKEELFPPTKAPSDDPGRLTNNPALVSIVDLDSLLYWEEHKPKYLPAPTATFALVDGCNFLSVSATGTRLLTSSRKGEVSTMWDLTQIAHGSLNRATNSSAEISLGPCIKQLQRIARNSPSTVLECAWSRDDDSVAILTAHGTVHLHEVPKRPLAKKRKRAGTLTTQAPAIEKADATVSLSAGTSPPSANQGFLGSIKSSWQTVSTQVNSIRSTNPASALGLPTTFAGFREVTAAAGTAGSRAVARGLSQGYTAAKGGASDYWHADDNKIRHTKAIQEPFSASSLQWMRRNNTTSVAIACGGNVHVHPVQHVTRRKGDVVVSGLKHERYAHKVFPLPAIATNAEADLNSLKTDSCTGQGPHGFWSLRHSSPTATAEGNASSQQSKLQQTQINDVETNPPYCPFHVDARVNIHAYDENATSSQLEAPASYEEFHVKGHGAFEEDPWAFGGPLPPSTKVNDRIPDELLNAGFEHDEDDYDDDEEEDEHDISSQVESKLTIQPARMNHDGQQIRITTRRRQGKKSPDEADGDFHLLEDDADMK